LSDVSGHQVEGLFFTDEILGDILTN
jgi:hypothetical protein